VNPAYPRAAAPDIPCFHGGAFFEAIGVEFGDLARRHQIINADVLDAWFPPAPAVVEILREHLPWILRTSPPLAAEGMVSAIARARGVDALCVLPTAGSSDAIFLALRHWLHGASRVLILDPTYGEYAHVLERVIQCRVDRFLLSRDDGYRVDLAALEEAFSRAYDLIVLVNPNSPTGRHISRAELQELLRRAPRETRFWIDETYVEYAGAGESLERFATSTGNVVICTSMSKAYALSGVRAAYLCGSQEMIAELRAITPPWSVSLPAQIAAVTALGESAYYADCHAQTHGLRAELAAMLRDAVPGIEIVPGVANFLLCHLPERAPDAATIVQRCRSAGLFVRDASAMGTALGGHALRIAVKDRETNRRIVALFAAALAPAA